MTADGALHTRTIRSAGVVGAGTMGTGIAMTFANAGIPVALVDASPEASERARVTIVRTYAAAVARGRLSQAASDERLGDIAHASDFARLAGVDVAIEAVYEDLAVKTAVFARLGALCEPDALLATNTSTLDVDAIARAAPHPERALGLHFFSPAHVMPLLEVVRGAHTSAETIARAVDVGQRLGKLPVVVGNGDGFVGNRMLLGYRREAEFALLAGATPERVDAALRAFGFAMGVFAVSDLAGIDVGYRAKLEREKRGAAPPFVVTALPDALVAAGRLGCKSGAGYFRYAAGDRTPHPDPALEPFVAAERARLGVPVRAPDDAAIVERCVYALVTEGARILEEGIASSARDVDAIWVNGYGFPRERGGPMHFAETVGVANVVNAVRALAERDPAFWRISPVLAEAARTGRFP